MIVLIVRNELAVYSINETAQVIAMISPSKVVTNLCMWSLSTVGSTKMLDLLVRGVVTIGNTIKIK